MAVVDSDAEGVEFSLKRLLAYLGEDPDREGLRETPARMRRAFEELTSGYKQSVEETLETVFTEPYDEMVIVGDIPFWSLCEHHLLPFHGTATVAYLPDGKVVGLSKIPRLVQCFARRLQIQERMTQEIAHAIRDHVNPLGVGVIIRAHHTCMQMRGVRSQGAMTTSCLLGAFRDQAETRAEFLNMARENHK